MRTAVLKQAAERTAQQPELEQEASAHAILEMLEADANWEALLSDPRTPELLDERWAEAQDDIKTGHAEEIPSDGFLS